ncbi:protamine-like isoform X2 [Leptidea sinapis]|nr:protamine-like isoform X2 [Leptidea sinapis]
MDPEDDQERKLNDEMVTFLKKRSDHDGPRYIARINKYQELNRKRRRAAAARRNSEVECAAAKKKIDSEQRDKSLENKEYGANQDDRLTKRRTEKGLHKAHSTSRTNSEPADKCCRRRRRKRSCSRRRRRRRRSCRRRRRRRSCSRRRRRRSCRRRRRRRRRRRCGC